MWLAPIPLHRNMLIWKTWRTRWDSNPRRREADGLRDRSLCRSGHWSNWGTWWDSHPRRGAKAPTGLKVLADRCSGHTSRTWSHDVGCGGEPRRFCWCLHDEGASCWCTLLESNQLPPGYRPGPSPFGLACVVGASLVRPAGAAPAASAMSKQRSADELRTQRDTWCSFPGSSRVMSVCKTDAFPSGARSVVCLERFELSLCGI
jgi:hypothetical protein